jgi:hypothetical protein
MRRHLPNGDAYLNGEKEVEENGLYKRFERMREAGVGNNYTLIKLRDLPLAGGYFVELQSQEGMQVLCIQYFDPMQFLGYKSLYLILLPL